MQHLMCQPKAGTNRLTEMSERYIKAAAIHPDIETEQGYEETDRHCGAAFSCRRRVRIN